MEEMDTQMMVHLEIHLKKLDLQKDFVETAGLRLQQRQMMMILGIDSR
jgi:hypothetical protein